MDLVKPVMKSILRDNSVGEVTSGKVLRVTRPNVSYVLPVGIVVVIGVFLRWFHYVGPMAGDESAWLLASQRVFGVDVAGADAFHPVYYNRPLWLLALAVFPGVFEDASLLLPWTILMAACNTFLVVCTTRLLFEDNRAACIAGLIYAIHPISIEYDVIGLPDSLGLTVLLVSFFFAARFIRFDRRRDLILAAACSGITYGFKEYFPLLVAPYGIALFGVAWGCPRIFSRLLLLGTAFFLAVLAVICVKKLMPDKHLDWIFADYSTRVADKDGAGVVMHDAQSLLSNLSDRTWYLRWLIANSGLLIGPATILGITLFAFRSLRDYRARLVMTSLACILGFLMFCLAPSWPLVFVEMQRRYLTIVIPFVSIMCGVAISSVYSAVPAGVLRTSLRIYFVIGLIVTAMMPNDARNCNYGQYTVACLRASAEYVASDPGAKLLVADKFAIKLPLALGQYRDVVEYMSLSDATALADFAASGDHIDRRYYVYVESNSIHNTTSVISENGLTGRNVDISVPHTSFRRLLERLGVRAPGRFEGALLLISPQHESDKSNTD